MFVLPEYCLRPRSTPAHCAKNKKTKTETCFVPGKSLANLLVYAEYEFIDVKHCLRFTGLLNQRKMYESGNKAFLGLALCEATLTGSHLNLWLFGELGFWGQGTKNACTDKTLNSKTGCKKSVSRTPGACFTCQQARDYLCVKQNGKRSSWERQLVLAC